MGALGCDAPKCGGGLLDMSRPRRYERESQSQVQALTNQNFTGFAMCTSTSCSRMCHVSCLGDRYVGRHSLVPTGGECPSCGSYERWGEVIRGCYARKDGTERETDIRRKQLLKSTRGRRKKAVVGGDETENAPSSSMSSLSLASPTKKSRRGKKDA